MNVHTTTINVGGKRVSRTWDTVEKMKAEWFGENWNGPSLDDDVISARVNGLPVPALTFENVMEFLKTHFDFNY